MAIIENARINLYPVLILIVLFQESLMKIYRNWYNMRRYHRKKNVL